MHGDMHAGNLLVDARTGKVTVLDAGLAVALSPASRAFEIAR